MPTKANDTVIFVAAAASLLLFMAAMIWASWWFGRPKKQAATPADPPYQPDQEYAHHPQDERKLAEYLRQRGEKHGQ